VPRNKLDPRPKFYDIWFRGERNKAWRVAKWVSMPPCPEPCNSKAMKKNMVAVRADLERREGRTLTTTDCILERAAHRSWTTLLFMENKDEHKYERRTVAIE
jgi:hypothetical protein